MKLIRGKAKGEFNPGASKLHISIPYTNEEGKTCFVLQVIRDLQTNISEGFVMDYINKNREKRYEWSHSKMDSFNDELERWNKFDLSDLEAYLETLI